MNRVADILVVDFYIGPSKNTYSKKVFREEDKDGLHVLHIHVRSRFYKLLYYSLIFQKKLLNRTLKEEKIDISSFNLIMTNVVFPSGIVGLELAKKYGYPLIHIEHWSYLKTFLEKDIHKNKARKVLSYAKKIIVVSDILKNELKGYCDLEKVSIVPNVISSSFNYVIRSKVKGKVNFLAIANWRKPKNPFVFIEALRQLQLEQPATHFEVTLIGEGVQLEEIKQLKLPFTINYPGKIPNLHLQEYFNETDVFLHGSDFETFSIVPIEALMAGVPVVASKVGVLPSVITNENGFLCENNVEDWKKCILECLKKEYDHVQISEKMKGVFTIEKVASLLDEIISK